MVSDNKKHILDIYIATIPDKVDIMPLSNEERNREISAVANDELKREKYYVWKLLEHALYHSFGLCAENMNFTKSENGKWFTDSCHFSLSHSKRAVAVSVSCDNNGVDIECFEKPRVKGFAERILTERERGDYDNTPLELRDEFLTKKWCAKESVFKAYGSRMFVPREIETDGVYTQKITLRGGSYILSVAADNYDNMRIIEVDAI